MHVWSESAQHRHTGGQHMRKYRDTHDEDRGKMNLSSSRIKFQILGRSGDGLIEPRRGIYIRTMGAGESVWLRFKFRVTADGVIQSSPVTAQRDRILACLLAGRSSFAALRHPCRTSTFTLRRSHRPANEVLERGYQATDRPFSPSRPYFTGVYMRTQGS